MRIALLGSRGIPAHYSGFETFYEALAVRLADRGHDVTVYCRTHFFKEKNKTYKGVRTVFLPSIPTKHLDTITHTALATLHAVSQRYDIVYYCIVGNSPLVWIPRLFGSRTLLNVDGEDWAREKWGPFARWYQKKCERIAAKTAHCVIADARIVRTRYQKEHSAQTVFVPYGAEIRHTDQTTALAKWCLSPQNYVLYVGRLVPENRIHELLTAYKSVSGDRKLVIIGDAPYMDTYKQQLRNISDPRVVFTGYAFDTDYEQLSSHAYFYVQPSGVEGTRPALLDQMGFGNCVLVRNTEANTEVIADCGLVFDRNDPADLTSQIQKLVNDPAIVRAYREKSAARIRDFYNWDWITDFYEDLFSRLKSRRELISYDDYLAARTRENPKIS